MAELQRRLAAILYADVAGYSRLTGEDEDGTHLMLRSALEGIAATIHDHSGHVVHYAGDAVLAEFSTVVDALESAVAIQHKVTATNADVDPGRRVQFRIGVNLGDVIVDRDDIYGDGVNVAARLESLADTGGICISESVRVAIGSRLQLEYRFIGAQKVKNISEPVRAYHVLFDQPFLELASQELFEQEVKFHTTPDGVSLAYSSMGAGKPLVRAGMWVNHLEYEMQSALWASWWQELAQSYSLVRYDQRGNGLSDRQVIWKHAFRNALYPLITIFASVLPGAFGGSVIVEEIFNIQGMGKLLFDSIQGSDWQVVYTIIMIASVLTVAGILLADMLYAWADPRVRFGK